jgi:hypothetical protein
VAGEKIMETATLDGKTEVRITDTTANPAPPGRRADIRQLLTDIDAKL